MCVGEPMRLLAIDGITGTAAVGAGVQLVDLSLTPDAVVGDWVLGFLGSAHRVIDAAEAKQIAGALEALRRVMAGDGAGDGFADLDRPPQLPPHLQAALDAGRSHG